MQKESFTTGSTTVCIRCERCTEGGYEYKILGRPRKHFKFDHIEQEHLPQLLVLFGLRPDMDYNRVNPMS